MSWLAGLGAIASFALAGVAQEPAVEVLLRDGRSVVVTGLRGDVAGGFRATSGGAAVQLAGADVLLVRGVAVAPPALPTAWLAGGDVVRGAVVGGDDGGNRIELQSPVLGRVALAVDRLEALASPALAEPLRLRLPDGVDEALFVRAKVGFDVLAGSLHRFGEAGVRFEAEGAAARWFGFDAIAALRLRDADARAEAPTATLWTRAGDRLGVSAVQCRDDGVHVELEGGVAAVVRHGDVAALAFPGAHVFLSDLEPAAVRESGFDGDVVHPYRRDRNAVGGPLVVGGRACGKGLGVHSQCRLSYAAPARTEALLVRVGFDDSVAALGLEPRVAVRVLVGDVVAFERKDFCYGQPAQDVGVVRVRPGDVVTLEVDHGKARDLGDRIDWIAPVFVLARE